MAASASFSLANTRPRNPLAFAAMVMGSTPVTGLICPSSESSPTIMYSASVSAGSSPAAPSKAIAMGRSNPEPILRKGAGARLTTILRIGKLKPELANAARMRSRLSRMVPSGNPTMVNWLSPSERSTSTSMQ